MDAGQAQGQLAATLLALLVALAAPAAAGAAKREYWVAAVPKTWNLAPNQRDAILDVEHPPAETVFGTTVYQRYTRGWKRPIRNAPRNVIGANGIPGPLIRARVGDRVLVHFKNADPARAHSMHFHGFSYKPTSDGAYLPGFSGPDGDVQPGKKWTYRFRAGRLSAGFWPYHDHSTSMHESIGGGMFGGISILRRRERRPDREFVVTFAALHEFQTINGRAFVGNTPVYDARVGERVRWNVMAMGSEHHTFHVHGHRWRDAGTRRGRDTQTLGPAESFTVDWKEDAPGTWFYHCHVEDHMERGMIGIYRVRK